MLQEILEWRADYLNWEWWKFSTSKIGNRLAAMDIAITR